MSVGYRSVTWSRFKVIYDLLLLAGVCLYLWVFFSLAPQFWEDEAINGPVIRMRAFGSCAFLMLTLILCMGPLARLDSRFLPLVFNRRHFGVFTFVVALFHVKAVLDWYYSFGPSQPLDALAVTLTSGWNSFIGFPFEVLGALALLQLALMAATSHDFWLKFLGPPLWKNLHMGIYVAYGLLVMHIGLGFLQSNPHSLFIGLLFVAVVAVVGLHLLAGYREYQRDAAPNAAGEDSWVKVGSPAEIPDQRAQIVVLADGSRVAVFRYGNQVSAVSNVCAHQNGPLGEGRMIDGCITCPWHGFQYLPHNGCSPPPFNEKVPTYQLRLDGDTLWLNPVALPAGTAVEPVTLEVSHAI